MTEGRKIGRGCGAAALVFGGMLVGAAASVAAFYAVERADRRERLDHSLNGQSPIIPVWLRKDVPCAPANTAERRMDDSMLDVANAAAADRGRFGRPFFGAGLDYSISYFSWHWELLNSKRCPPDRRYVAALEPILTKAGWPQSNTPSNELRLVERMTPNAALAHRLAGIAFLGWMPPASPTAHDSRPYARMLLGDQGRFAAPWAGKALGAIGGDTKLGTSAAYLAVAADPQRALPMVERTMAAKLRASLARKITAYSDGGEVPAIRPDDADRLNELAYALGRAGRAADAHSRPLLAVLDQRFARPAPPFGLLTAAPSELCRVAEWIGGRTAAIAHRKPACQPGVAGDGSPRSFP